jgi:hypothetical protein
MTSAMQAGTYVMDEIEDQLNALDVQVDQAIDTVRRAMRDGRHPELGETHALLTVVAALLQRT